MKPEPSNSAARIDELNQALDQDGYAVVPDALDAAWVERLRLAFDHAPAQSGGTQHVEITDATPEAASWRAVEHHPVLNAAAEHVLSRPYCLAGIHGRNPLPGFGQQGLHSDWPRGPDHRAVLLTALWMLDDFTLENGATRVVPGSHRITRPLAKDLAQPLAKHQGERVVIGRAGSVLMFNGYLWHSGRRNDSNAPRRAVQMAMRRGTASETLAKSFMARSEQA
ncbi:MAG: phytanoyl-CoA dioxygenase family protein [Alphaproteobacteria bacterium]